MGSKVDSPEAFKTVWNFSRYRYSRRHGKFQFRLRTFQIAWKVCRRSENFFPISIEFFDSNFVVWVEEVIWNISVNCSLNAESCLPMMRGINLSRGQSYLCLCLFPFQLSPSSFFNRMLSVSIFSFTELSVSRRHCPPARVVTSFSAVTRLFFNRMLSVSTFSFTELSVSTYIQE